MPAIRNIYSACPKTIHNRTNMSAPTVPIGTATSTEPPSMCPQHGAASTLEDVDASSVPTDPAPDPISPSSHYYCPYSRPDCRYAIPTLTPSEYKAKYYAYWGMMDQQEARFSEETSLSGDKQIPRMQDVDSWGGSTSPIAEPQGHSNPLSSFRERMRLRRLPREELEKTEHWQAMKAFLDNDRFKEVYRKFEEKQERQPLQKKAQMEMQVLQEK
ncbi:hypothetical protein BJ508DRAFT_313206 [Ascobolus immersus RN42]|uniref:Uncharacterized protein n=1 Tax=Ascobolus immersus RN42 TaxID=1160509 RepID=A0A3N4HJH4_ASCIM|nr:hypothetical protein BJ508DRAFT_313206 [Ascobolus immersus RN42]